MIEGKKRESIFVKWKQRAQELKRQVYTLYLANKDPRTPWYAKVLTGLVVAYALSPIDLIPDFIPVLGYLDDLILVPLGIAAAIKMIPPEVMEECRVKAQTEIEKSNPASRVVAAVIILVWIGFAIILVKWLMEWIK
jgi:uncharacterized membrane protein YkvA (DUF1232 family)